MKRRTLKTAVAIMAVAACGIPFGVSADDEVKKTTDCASLAAALEKSVEANRSQVLILVEDAMIANGECARELTQAAIRGAGADRGTAEANATAKQIVLAAILTNPNKAAEIAEAAIAVAPKAQAHIQEGYAEAMGEADSKGVLASFGKNPVITPAPDLVAPDVRGVYLVAPGGGVVVVEEERVVVREKIKRVPGKPRVVSRSVARP